MSGLILIFIIVLWVMAVKKLTAFFTKAMPVNGFSKIVKILLFSLIFVLPFVDEIIGGFQFRALCEAETQLKYDKDKLSNKSVYSDLLDAVQLKGMAIPVISQTQTYTDIQTHELLLSFKDLNADGGWLSRAIAFNSVHAPYTFNGHCGFGWVKVTEIFKSLNVTIIKKNSGE